MTHGSLEPPLLKSSLGRWPAVEEFFRSTRTRFFQDMDMGSGGQRTFGHFEHLAHTICVCVCLLGECTKYWFSLWFPFDTSKKGLASRHTAQNGSSWGFQHLEDGIRLFDSELTHPAAYAHPT